MSDTLTTREPAAAGPAAAAPAGPAAADPAAPAERPGDLAPDLDLDCRGLSCPLPVINTKKAIMQLAKGQVLRVTATDPGSVPDMAAFSRRTGHPILEQSAGGGQFVFYFRVGK